MENHNYSDSDFESAMKATKEFLEQIADIEFECGELHGRRERTVDLLLEQTGSVVGYWAFGHGHPMKGQVVPLAWIPRGVPPEQTRDFVELGLSAQSYRWMREPFIALLQKQKQVCHSRSEFYSDEVWQGSELVSNLHPLGVDNWMIAVRYTTVSEWSSLTLFRPVGSPDFSPADRTLLDLVLASKNWLHYRSSCDIGAKASELNKRNATVLLMLLDGSSRKEIAAKMKISLHMVNDSIKAIYRHFGTCSATELAARFLKGA